MKLGKQFPKDIISSAVFPLTLSIACYFIEYFVSFFNFDISAPQWHLTNQSFEPENSLPIIFLRNIRELMTNSYGAYFNFMKMMVTLHIMGVIIRFSQKYLKEKSSMTFPEAESSSEEAPLPHSLRSNAKKRYLFKTIQCLIYFTVIYYLGQLAVRSLDSSSRSILVRAKDAPNQFNRRMLEELKQQERDEEDAPNDTGDRLTSITKLKGATATIVSKDGNKIFQLSQKATPASRFDTFLLFGMDISNPLAIKSYPSREVSIPSGKCPKSLALSSDASTLFLIDCKLLRIYNVSDSTNFPMEISATSLGDLDPMYSEGFLSVALYEEEKTIIILYELPLFFNISDLRNPKTINISINLKPGPSIVPIPQQRKALVGGRDGFTPCGQNLSILISQKFQSFNFFFFRGTHCFPLKSH